MKQVPGFIHLRPKTSPCLAGFILISHLLAALAPFFSTIPNVAKWLLLAVVMFNWYLLWRKLITRSSAGAILRADWLADDSWQIIDGEGKAQQVASWILLLNTPALIMLKFKMHHNSAVTLIICPDSIDGEVSRQLRVRLNTGSALYPTSAGL